MLRRTSKFYIYNLLEKEFLYDRESYSVSESVSLSQYMLLIIICLEMDSNLAQYSFVPYITLAAYFLSSSWDMAYHFLLYYCTTVQYHP